MMPQCHNYTYTNYPNPKNDKKTAIINTTQHSHLRKNATIRSQCSNILVEASLLLFLLTLQIQCVYTLFYHINIHKLYLHQSSLPKSLKAIHSSPLYISNMHAHNFLSKRSTNLQKIDQHQSPLSQSHQKIHSVLPTMSPLKVLPPLALCNRTKQHTHTV